MPRSCKNSTDCFCYVCGEFVLKTHRNVMTDLVKTAYNLYFGFSIDERDKSWLPKVCCNSCSRTLRGWLEGSHKSMPFTMPMIWSEPQNHENDCYFCMTSTRGFSKKNKNKIVYPNIPSAKRPIPRDQFLARLFIDASKISLKAVLHHNGNKYPSVPVAHATNMKENYANLEVLLEKIQYSQYLWNICADLKVVAILTGLQGGYTKFCCFLCEWDSRAREKHYKQKSWPLRKSLTPGLKNVSQKPLVPSEKIFLPPLHIKLGLMKNFVKAINKDGAGFQYLKTKFPRISDAKLKEGIFVGPQIRELMKDEAFESKLSKTEKRAWVAFVKVCHNFLGNTKVDNYRQIIRELLSAYKSLGCNMEPYQMSMVKGFIKI
nr:uncharacterized protein LOC118680996 [Bactrocera oleae]